MISQEQQAEMLVVTESKESEKTFTSTHIPSEYLTNLTNPPASSSSLISAASSDATANSTVNSVIKKPNLNTEVVLNVKCQCNIENSNCIASSPKELNHSQYNHHHYQHLHQYSHQKHCMSSAYFYELPTKFSLLPKVIGVSANCNKNEIGNSSEQNGKEHYSADTKRCWPPPLFVIFISLLEVSFNSPIIVSHRYGV